MKKALIIVDYQNDFVNGSLGFPQAPALEKKIEQKIKQALKNKTDLIFTLDTHLPDYMNTQEGRNLPISHCIKRTPGWEVYGRINAYLPKATKIFEKNTFGSLELAAYLQQHGYNEIELAGLVSNICVLSNAILAKTALPEAVIIVDPQATASADPKLHQQTLDVMRGLQIQCSNK